MRGFLKNLTACVVECYQDRYLRLSNENADRILSHLVNGLQLTCRSGSIDCCKWKCKNYPTTYHGQYIREEKVPTVTMKAIAYDILYFGTHFLVFQVETTILQCLILSQSYQRLQTQVILFLMITKLKIESKKIHTGYAMESIHTSLFSLLYHEPGE